MRAVLQDSWQKLSRSGTAADPAVALLPELRVLRFQGSDVLSFLQGYLTVDTDDLPADAGRLAALTNLQGRVVADGWCANPAADVVEWAVHGSLADPVAGFLHRYLAFSRTSVEVRADDHLVVGVLEPDRLPNVRVLDDEADLSTLLESHAAVSADRWRAGCVDGRIALVSQPTSEAFLPQMLGLVEAGAVDFDKGCYLGQEVVARAQHRGEVKRGLVRLQGPEPPLAAGDSLGDADDRTAGTVISAAADGAGQRCLAVVRLPAVAAYRAGDRTLTPY